MEKEKLVSLVTAAQQGDTDALNQLFNTFYNDVYYFALKTVKDEELACDITQETFVEIINTLGNLQEPAAFVTWMKQITYHQCTRYFKKKKDVLVDEDEEGNTVFDTLREERAEFIPDEALDKEDFRKTILGMIDQLSDEQRAATMLFYFEEMSVKDIAALQGVSEGTVKSRLNYARKAIKTSVEDYEKKNGVKLHSFALLPLLLWLFKDTFTKGISAASAQAMAAGVSSATGVSVSVAGGTATAAAATATGIGAKIAAAPIAAKVTAGVLSVALVGGGIAAVTLGGHDHSWGDWHYQPPKQMARVCEECDETESRAATKGEIEKYLRGVFSTLLFQTENLGFFDAPEAIDFPFLTNWVLWEVPEKDRLYEWNSETGTGYAAAKTEDMDKVTQDIFGKTFDYTVLSDTWLDSVRFSYNAETGMVERFVEGGGEGDGGSRETTLDSFTTDDNIFYKVYYHYTYDYGNGPENRTDCVMTVMNQSGNYVALSNHAIEQEKDDRPDEVFQVPEGKTLRQVMDEHLSDHPYEAIQFYSWLLYPEIPDFASVEQLPADDAARLLYEYWDTWMSHPEYKFVRYIEPGDFHEICQYFLGRTYDVSEFTGKYAVYHENWDLLEMTPEHIINGGCRNYDIRPYEDSDHYADTIFVYRESVAEKPAGKIPEDYMEVLGKYYLIDAIYEVTMEKSDGIWRLASIQKQK